MATSFTVATPSPAYHRAAGFQSVFCRPTGELWQTLGSVAEGVLNFNNYAELDSMGRNKAHAVEFTAKVKMKQASETEIDLLDTITAGTCDFLFKLSDAGAIPGTTAVTEGWVEVSSSQVGIKATLDASGDPGNNRFILLEWQGSLLFSELDAAVKADIDDDDFEATGGSGTLRTIGTYTAAKDGGKGTPANIKPCGVTAVTLADTGEAAQTLGAVKNAKITFSQIAEVDSLRRFLPYAYDVNIEYDWMQTNAANMIQLDSIVDGEIDLHITMMGGSAILLTNEVGIQSNYEVSGDYDKIKVVRFTHKGKILRATLESTVIH